MTLVQRATSAQTADLLEDATCNLDIQWDAVRFDLKPHEILTIRVKLSAM